MTYEGIEWNINLMSIRTVGDTIEVGAVERSYKLVDETMGDVSRKPWLELQMEQDLILSYLAFSFNTLHNTATPLDLMMPCFAQYLSQDKIKILLGN